jgi:hypothetical protein
MKQKLLLCVVAVSSFFFGVSQTVGLGNVSIGMLGDFNGWSNDVPMSTTDNENYTISAYTFTISGNVKFRQNGGWDTNWGGSTFPTGTAVPNGGNILVPAGTYDIVLNVVNDTYSFTATSSGFDDIGFIGAFNSWSESVPMVTTDGVAYTRPDFYFGANNVKFRKDNQWTENWGGTQFPSGPAVPNSNDDIPLISGYYNVQFNLATPSYNFQVVPVGIIGTAYQGWETELAMQTEDNGISFTLQNIVLNNGELKFRANQAWALNWGGTTFPAGTAAPNSVDETPVQVVAGTYNISFNRLTLAYNFETVLSNTNFDNISVKVYPNPAKSVFNVSLTNADVTKVELFDITGKLVSLWNGNQRNVAISTNGIGSGLYVVRISSGEMVKTSKLVIE